ncbi:MAG: hypothetical protein KatS3mg109_0078 [Pirellulaceae bacterium]|nr:MAG: hypothetical protein KatS3mg109_0078 [Pirellulaceae bacterium]
MKPIVISRKDGEGFLISSPHGQSHIEVRLPRGRGRRVTLVIRSDFDDLKIYRDEVYDRKKAAGEEIPAYVDRSAFDRERQKWVAGQSEFGDEAERADPPTATVWGGIKRWLIQGCRGKR